MDYVNIDNYAVMKMAEIERGDAIRSNDAVYTISYFNAFSGNPKHPRITVITTENYYCDGPHDKGWDYDMVVIKDRKPVTVIRDYYRYTRHAWDDKGIPKERLILNALKAKRFITGPIIEQT